MFLRYLFPGHIRFTLTISRTTEVIGVNSNVQNDRHILLWDFDNVRLARVSSILRPICRKNRLSNVYIFRTRKDHDNYHAFCLKSFTLAAAVSIIAATPEVDWAFVKWGVVRSHFTLRIGPKDDEIPWFVRTIKGRGVADVTWRDLKGYTKYETRAGKYA